MNYKNNKQSDPELFIKSSSSVSVYTVLCILQAMNKQLGLEAMLEYKAKYLEIIEENNPELKRAVNKALALMNIEKMYKDVLACEGK